jgi:hypothetical protein
MGLERGKFKVALAIGAGYSPAGRAVYDTSGENELYIGAALEFCGDDLNSSSFALFTLALSLSII